MSKIALVTGGTRGIGAAIGTALKNAGYTVAANYAHNDARAESFTEETSIPTFKWDVAVPDTCIEGLKQVEAALGGPVDVLVNNAGITRDAVLHKMSDDEWHTVIETNLTSCYHMARTVLPAMREKHFGRIISISSVNAQLGQFGQTNYSAAKAGILGFTKALSRETASRGITVNSIAPGYINTDMVRNVAEDVMQEIVSHIPVGRLGTPEEVARCVVFLAADEAGFITGETISVNGGHHME